jgi:hypothetical protein
MLEQSGFGILCVTRRNFQVALGAAACRRTHREEVRYLPGRAVPHHLSNELPPTSEEFPRAQFWHVRVDPQGTHRWVVSVNNLREVPKAKLKAGWRDPSRRDGLGLSRRSKACQRLTGAILPSAGSERCWKQFCSLSKGYGRSAKHPEAPPQTCPNRRWFIAGTCATGRVSYPLRRRGGTVQDELAPRRELETWD